MPNRNPTPFEKLVSLGETQLGTINRLWNDLLGNTLGVLNEIRSLFNLNNMAEAGQVYQSAKAFAGTAAGQSVLGQSDVFDPNTIDLEPNLPVPDSFSDRYRYLVTFEIGGEFFSFYEWSEHVPTGRSIDLSVENYVRDRIDKYPRLSEILQRNPDEAFGVVLKDIRRRY